MMEINQWYKVKWTDEPTTQQKYEKYINYLRHQLQVYKDEEEYFYKNREIKIKNIINSYNYLIKNNKALEEMSLNILQILNEGE